MIGRPRINRRNRRALAANQIPPSLQATAAVTLNAGKMRLTSNLPLLVDGLPLGIKSDGASPTKVTVVSPTVLDLDFAVAPVAGKLWSIPAGCQELRTQHGGFVAAATGTF